MCAIEGGNFGDSQRQAAGWSNTVCHFSFLSFFLLLEAVKLVLITSDCWSPSDLEVQIKRLV